MYDKNGKFHLDAKDKAILQKGVYENPYIPFNPFPKQAEMILATEKEVLIGGAAGGSKSTLIHKASQWLNRKEVQNNASINQSGMEQNIHGHFPMEIH